MGGLRKYMPITFWTFLIAFVCQCRRLSRWLGSGPRTRSSSAPGRARSFRGSVTCDGSRLHRRLHHRALHVPVVFLTFFGKQRFDTEHVHPHESPRPHDGSAGDLAAVTIVFGRLSAIRRMRAASTNSSSRSSHAVESAEQQASLPSRLCHRGVHAEAAAKSESMKRADTISRTAMTIIFADALDHWWRSAASSWPTWST